MKQKLLSFLVLCSLLIGVAHAQNRTITGRVTSTDDGSPLSGVTVLVRGTNQAVQTEENGSYSIQITSGTTLLFRYIGYAEKSVAIGSNNVINVELSSDENIDEVVVIGYGSGTNLSTAVGSVAKISSKDIEARPTANVLEAMQGRVAGLQIFTSNGEPSATQSIRLRGVGSLGSSSTPLFVLDGVPVATGSIVSMNPEDFESMTVLKDASATAIYGSRAANGVIYLTTKKGKSGERATITARAQTGWSNLAQTKMQRNVMSTDELLNFWVETGERTQEQVDKLREDFPNNTSWFDYYYKKNRPIQQYDVNVSGGSEKTRYYISGGFFDQEGLMYRSGFDRITLRSNIDSRLNDWMRIGINLAGGFDRRETNGWGSNDTNGGLAMLAQPFYTPYDENGNEYYGELIPGWGRYSPRYIADHNTNKFYNKQFNPTGYLEIKPISNLTFRSQVGMDHYTGRRTVRRLPSYAANPNNGAGREEYQDGTTRTWTNTLEYALNINENHSLTLLGGQEWVDYKYDYFDASSTGMIDDNLILIGAGPTGRSVSQSRTEYAFSSFFGRASYNYQSKYFLDGTIRQDRSSRFGADHEAATFWSLGGMWHAKQENFLQDASWLTDLKVRLSYGTTGNSEIGNYRHLALVGNTIYNGGTGWTLTQPGVPSLGWEKQAMLSTGINAEFFDKLTIDLEYYYRNTTNMLVNVPYPYTTGFSDIYNNVGSLNNRGVELSASYRFDLGSDFYIQPSIVYNYNTEKVTELFDDKDYWVIPNTGVAWAVGQPLRFFYPVKAGVNTETGRNEWYVPGEDIMQPNKDPNNVTSSFSAAALEQNTGLRRYPPHNGGFALQAGYKGFTFSTNFAFSKGKYLINNDRFFYENPYNFYGFNQSRNVLDYWKEPGDQTSQPRYGEINQFDTSLLEDASFLRLKTLELSYNLPRSLTDRSNFFKGVRIFYMGRNLLTFTKYLGPDPEVDSNLALGVNPNTKQSTIGLQVQF